MRYWSRIGIDIGSVRVKAAQCDRSGRIVRLARFPRRQPDAAIDQAEAMYIADVLLRQDFQPAAVVLAGDTGRLRLEELEIPPVEEHAAAARIVAAELTRITRWAPGTFEYAWWRIPPAPQRTSAAAALAVAASHAHSERFIESFTAVGMDVEAIDVGHVASARACAALAGENSLTCMVDVGWKSAELTACSNEQVLFIRSLPGSGVQSVAEAIEVEPARRSEILSRLLATDEEELSRSPRRARRDALSAIPGLASTLAVEVERSIAYVARRFPGHDRVGVCVFGGGAALPGLIGQLQDSLEQPVMTATPSGAVECAPAAGRLAEDPSLIAACGLALWGE